MPPPHHPDPPERALEPQFVAVQGLGDSHASGGGTRLDGPTPARPKARSLLPWVFLAGVLAAAAWALVTVVLPLRREAMQCQAQLLAAQSAFAVPVEMEPAAGEEPTADGAASQAQVDALVARLVMALGPEAALGQVAVHPDEGCVRVVVPGDVAGQEMLEGMLVRVGQEARAMPTPWRVVLEASRPIWDGLKPARGKHRGRKMPSPPPMLRALAAADAAFGASQVPWVLQLVSLPEGGVVLRLEPLPEAAGQ